MVFQHQNYSISIRLWRCRMYQFPQLAVYFIRAVNIPFSTTNTSSMDVLGVCVPFHRFLVGSLTNCIQVQLLQWWTCRCRVYVSIFIFVKCLLNARMPEYPASCQSGTRMNKMPMPVPVRYRNKGTQYGIEMFRYRTVIPDAGMSVPGALASMAMPSYA